MISHRRASSDERDQHWIVAAAPWVMVATGLLVPLLLVVRTPEDAGTFSLLLCVLAVSSAALGLHALLRRDARLGLVTRRLDAMLSALSIPGPGARADTVEALEARMDALDGAVETVRHRFAQRHRATGLPTREPLLEVIRGDLDQGREGTLGIFEFRDFERLSGFDPGVADDAIASLAGRIRTMVGNDEHVAQIDRSRLGVWLGGKQPPAASAEIEAMRYALGSAIRVEGQDILPEIASGSAGAPDDGDSAETLLAAAISALSGGASDVVIDGDAPLSATDRVRDAFALEQDLRRAVAQGEFELEYQPLVDAREQRVCGVEALIRWRHPTRGLVMPGQFIPAVERIGLAEEVGMWALNTACRQVRQWRQAGLERFRVAVNLSAHQLAREDLPAMIKRTMARHSLEPGMLEIELTETVAAGDVDRARRLFDGVRKLGVGIAIDDFGTGFASLSYLRQLSFDKLKIDREFVTEVDQRPASQAICQSLIALARGLGIQVLAEGVERAEEYLWLRQHGCNFFQGFHFARPSAGDRIVALVADPELAQRIAAVAPHHFQDQIRKRMQQ